MNAQLNGFNAVASSLTETEPELRGTRLGSSSWLGNGLRIYLKMLLELDWKNSRHIWCDGWRVGLYSIAPLESTHNITELRPLTDNLA